MSRGFPSMTALLGLIAIAGFQNRDKIMEMLGGAGGGKAPEPGPTAPDSDAHASAQSKGQGGLLGGLGGALAGGGAGGALASGLGELVERFQQKGHGEAAQSWVNQGPNKPLPPNQLEEAIGPDVLDILTEQTGRSRQELLQRLSRDLPDAVDRYTPDGRI